VRKGTYTLSLQFVGDYLYLAHVNEQWLRKRVQFCG